ncbi:MAG TPA: hypothetical protein VLW52_10885 [Opitutaceae bacterium]|nr:hypothetical protein [Opitutaceae bacterium]
MVLPHFDAHWLHFAAVVAVQLVLLVVVARIRRGGRSEVVRALAVGLGAGLVLGAAFDLIIGSAQGVFSYHLPPAAVFIFANGLLSYGLACATAWFFPVVLTLAAPDVRRRGGVILALAAAAAVVLLTGPWTVPAWGRMMASGAAILATGELGVTVLGRTGPLLQCVQGNCSSLLGLWRWSVLTGLVYELANVFFPVWTWSALASWPVLLREAVIVVFGYVVLCHPLVLVGRLLIARPPSTTCPTPREA